MLISCIESNVSHVCFHCDTQASLTGMSTIKWKRRCSECTPHPTVWERTEVCFGVCCCPQSASLSQHQHECVWECVCVRVYVCRWGVCMLSVHAYLYTWTLKKVTKIFNSNKQILMNLRSCLFSTKWSFNKLKVFQAPCCRPMISLVSHEALNPAINWKRACMWEHSWAGN